MKSSRLVINQNDFVATSFCPVVHYVYEVRNRCRLIVGLESVPTTISQHHAILTEQNEQTKDAKARIVVVPENLS